MRELDTLQTGHPRLTSPLPPAWREVSVQPVSQEGCEWTLTPFVERSRPSKRNSPLTKWQAAVNDKVEERMGSGVSELHRSHYHFILLYLFLAQLATQ